MRRIVVASGKGGTGKTTLTALFASFASHDGVVVLGDCDVEASNLPIALGAVGVEGRAFGGGAVARIDADACSACGACTEFCRFDAIEQVEARGGEVGRDGLAGPFRVDPLLCEGCGACLEAGCPEAAIELVDKDSGELLWGESTTGPIVFGRLWPGEDLSGKLVTEVRRKADEFAGAGGGSGSRSADLVLLDGPPGVGCPAIAAISGTDLLVAVTEPTVAGVHDLGRLVALARRLDLEVAVVLNKADLSVPGAASVRGFCAEESLPIVGEVPFDPLVAGALSAMAEGEEDLFELGRSPGFSAAAEAWSAI